MSIVPASSKVPVVPVVAGAVVAQFADDALRLLPLPFLGALSGLLAIALTAGAARVVTRGRTGAGRSPAPASRSARRPR